MNAIHIDWTRPSMTAQKEDFELLTMVLSALKWREKNGEIHLITDTLGKQYYKETGLDILWKSVSDELKFIPQSINPHVFWAAGKIFALKNQKAPIAVLDTDFIVWEKLPFEKYSDVSVIHFEDLYGDIYPDADYFKMRDGYSFGNLDWSIRASNTAFYVIKNNDFIKFYTDEAIRFMENAITADEPLKHMVFAEQRLFSMCAASLGIKISDLSDLDTLFSENSVFTHIWGMKQQMRDNDILRHDFCKKCMRRIRKDFPWMIDVLKNIPELDNGYFED